MSKRWLRWAAAAFVVAAIASLGILYAQWAQQNAVTRLDPAVLEHRAQLDAIEANRFAFVAEVVSRWQAYGASRGFSQGWEFELRSALLALPADRLLAAGQMESWEGLLRAIYHVSQPVAALAAATTGELGEALGSFTQDLVYYQVEPCRIIDTRNAGGLIAANSGRSFRTNNVTDFLSQGGSATNCNMPTLDPAAVAINVTVVASGSGSQPGDLRAYPFGSPAPNASVLNYMPLQNIANTTIVPICRICGEDISFFTDYLPVHLIVDVVGYFTAPQATALDVSLVETTQSVASAATFDLTASCPTGRTPTGGGYSYTVATANVWVWQSGPESPLTNTWRCRGANNSGSTISFTCRALCARVPGQ